MLVLTFKPPLSERLSWLLFGQVYFGFMEISLSLPISQVQQAVLGLQTLLLLYEAFSRFWDLLSSHQRCRAGSLPLQPQSKTLFSYI